LLGLNHSARDTFFTGKVTREELEMTVHASELAEEAALRLGAAVEGLGCLIVDDAYTALKKPNRASGALQGVDALDAFGMIAHGLQTIAGLAYAGHYAAVKLLAPQAYGYPRQPEDIRHGNEVRHA
jgi:hypothetical protein